jgi:TonB-dependent receptor
MGWPNRLDKFWLDLSKGEKRIAFGRITNMPITLRGTLFAGAALLSVNPSPLLAQQTAEASPPEADRVDDIIVTGTRQSLENALNTKRNSDLIVDSLSADGIGRIPDLNLAEALSRIPGVQINRSATRRTGTVAIRGLPGAFSQVLINGQYLASPQVTNFQFGVVNSDIFTGVDVIKAQDASTISGGLAGLINLRTGAALGSPESLQVSLQGYYEELTQRVAPAGAVSFNKDLIPGVLAVRAAVAIKRQDFREDNVQINTYDQIEGTATPQNPSDDLFIPRQVRLAGGRTKSTSTSASLGLDWQPTDRLRATVSGFLNDFRSDNYTSQFLFEALSSSVRTGDPASRVNAPGLGATITDVTIVDPTLFVDSRNIQRDSQTWALTGALAWEANDWKLRLGAHYTKASRESIELGYQAQQNSLAGTASNGLSVRFNTGAGNIDRILYDLTAGSPLLDLTQGFNAPTGPTFRSATARVTRGGAFVGSFRNDDEAEDELALQFDVERTFELGPISGVRAGAVWRRKSQDQRASLSTLFGTDLSQLNNGFYDFTAFVGRPYFAGRVNGFDADDYAELDVDAITRVLVPTINPANLPAGGFIGPDGLVNIIDSTARASFYDSEQDIYGGYALFDLDQQISSNIALRGNLGLRYEKTSRRTSTPLSPTEFRFDYDNLNPFANLIFELGPNVILRGSYTETFRRPQPDSFAVLRTVEVNANGTLVTANLGASDLRPFTSKNIDLSLEWYNRAGSVLSAAYFHRNVIDFAASTRSCPEDGGDFGFGPLSFTGGVCRTVQSTPAAGDFPTVQAGATVNINTIANQDAFKLEGFELTAQQNLSFLPAPWNGFGGQMNYTYVRFIPNSGSTFTISEISRDTINVILYYDTPRFSVRGAYNFRSPYFLASGGTISGADRFVDRRSQIDLSASFNVNDRLSLSAEAFNITNAYLYEYQGVRSRARNYTLFGRTFALGVRYRFR